MRRFRRGLLLASILATAPIALITAPPAQAQFSVAIGFDSFHGELAGYGDWLYSDRWGEVWRPDTQDRDPGWRPYWAGHWAYTDEYGWTWISDEGEWGDIAYHYGRWVFDPDDGWLWLPGYVWSPAWVVWRSSGPNVGWMPMPPDDDFLRPTGIRVGVSFGDWDDDAGFYGYSRWYGRGFDRDRFAGLWTFVPNERMADPGFHRFALAGPQNLTVVQNSRNITNYTVVNNIIVNRSVNITQMRDANGRAPEPVHANMVLRSTRWIAPVNQGEQVQARMRQERPHGNGLVNSAPPPTPQVINTLSTRQIPVRTQTNAPNAAPGNGPGNNGGGNRHLFNRDNAAQLAARGNAQLNPQPNAQQPLSQQPPQPNDNGRGRRDQNQPENRGPQLGGPPQAPNTATPSPQPNNPPINPPRGRGFERQQQQQQQAPQQQAPAAPPTPPPQEDRGNRNFQRPQQQAPERPPMEQRQQVQPERPQPPPPPERNFQRQPQQTPPPAMEQRPQPERAAPPPREATPPREQVQPQREQARPTPQNRGAQPDRGQNDRGNSRDKSNQDRRDNANR